MLWAVLIAWSGALVVSAAQPDEPDEPTNAQCSVTLRSGPYIGQHGSLTVTGSINSIDRGGIDLTGQDGLRRVVSWDAVARVTARGEGSGASLDRVRELATFADHAWRGSWRLRLNDWSGAESELREALESIRGDTQETLRSPTAYTVTTGIAAALIYQQRPKDAIQHWIAAVAARSAISQTSGRDSVTTIGAGDIHWIRITGDTSSDSRMTMFGLMPQAAPIWFSRDHLPGFPIWTSEEECGDQTAWMLHELYRVSTSEDGDPMLLEAAELADGSRDPAVELVRAMTRARSSSADDRARGRRTLLRFQAAPSSPEWARAWCGAAIGISLAMDGEQTRTEGLLSMLKVVAEHGDTHPRLAAACLAQSASILESMGEHGQASILEEELNRRYARIVNEPRNEQNEQDQDQIGATP